MNIKETSPAKLNNTQSILTSLYERIMQSTSSSPDPTDKAKNNYQKFNTTLQDPAQRQSYLINIKESPLLQKSALLTEPNYISDKRRNISCFSDLIDNQSDHKHSDHCCVIRNIQIQAKLKKANKNQFLLQSYRQQVEYLKKLSLLQSEQIQKLRRMLRNQQQQKIKEKGILSQSGYFDCERHKERATESKIEKKEKLKSKQKQKDKQKQRPKLQKNRRPSYLKQDKEDKKASKRKNSQF